jgi:anti-anti-sigma factor
MPRSSQHVDVREEGDVVVARPVGEEIEVLYESALIREIGETLYALAGDYPGRRIVVNLDGVKYAATEMLGKLASLNARIEKNGGRLVLCGLGTDVHEAMRIVRLLPLFEIADTEAEALGEGRPSPS